MSDPADRANRDPAPAVTRSAALLELLAGAHVPLTLTDLAKGLGLAKSSTANLCLALEAAGIIERVPAGYRLGMRLAHFGAAFVSQFNQVREFYAVCERSQLLANELVALAILDGADALYLARYEGANTGRFGTPIGSRLPAALTATGRALLMSQSPREAELLLESVAPISAIGADEPISTKELMRLLAESRDRGWALDDQESFPRIVGVAVPLNGWAASDPVFALGVALPAPIATRERIDGAVYALQAAAAALTNPFGR